MEESGYIRTIDNDYSHYDGLDSSTHEIRLLRVLPQTEDSEGDQGTHPNPDLSAICHG